MNYRKTKCIHIIIVLLYNLNSQHEQKKSQGKINECIKNLDGSEHARSHTKKSRIKNKFIETKNNSSKERTTKSII